VKSQFPLHLSHKIILVGIFSYFVLKMFANQNLTALPELSSGLEELYCNNNQLTTLPALPSTLRVLTCGTNQLTTLPELPSTLKLLICNNNQLTTLPALPCTLRVLCCHDNNYLTALPELLPTLKKLYCSNNQLTALPELSLTLKVLYCHDNHLTALPELPSTLEELYCHNNQLTTLPELPPTLGELWCHNNQLTTLPELPSTLKMLWCHGNQLTTLPELPPTLQMLHCSSNQLTTPPITQPQPVPSLLELTLNYVASSNHVKPLKIIELQQRIEECGICKECRKKRVLHDRIKTCVKWNVPGCNSLPFNGFEYDGFFSSREKAQDRIWYLFPLCEAIFYRDWLTSPTDEKKKQLMKMTRAAVITEHILDPAYPCHTVNVYFSEVGYVTNTLIDYPGKPVDNYFFAQHTVDFGKRTERSVGSQEPDCFGMCGNEVQLDYSLGCQKVVTETLTISEQFPDPDVSEDMWQRVATTYGIDLAKLRERQAQKDHVVEEDEEIPFDEEVEQIVKQLVPRAARSKTHVVESESESEELVPSEDEIEDMESHHRSSLGLPTVDELDLEEKDGYAVADNFVWSIETDPLVVLGRYDESVSNPTKRCVALTEEDLEECSRKGYEMLETPSLISLILRSSSRPLGLVTQDEDEEEPALSEDEVEVPKPKHKPQISIIGKDREQQCRGTTKQGQRCNNITKKGLSCSPTVRFCYLHDPDQPKKKVKRKKTKISEYWKPLRRRGRRSSKNSRKNAEKNSKSLTGVAKFKERAAKFTRHSLSEAFYVFCLSTSGLHGHSYLPPELNAYISEFVKGKACPHKERCAKTSLGDKCCECNYWDEMCQVCNDKMRCRQETAMESAIESYQDEYGELYEKILMKSIHRGDCIDAVSSIDEELDLDEEELGEFY
jgi:Leucine Rich repeats (2 copies)